MFKHYKLKPSFPIINDNKAKDRAGVGQVLLSVVVISCLSYVDLELSLTQAKNSTK